MMSKNDYLFLYNFQDKKVGSIVGYKYEEIKRMNNIKDKLVKLSVEESLFYQRYHEDVRVERYQADLFNKIKHLQTDYQCYLKIKNQIVKVKVLNRVYNNGGLFFNYKNMDGSMKMISVSNIEDVFSETEIQNQDKARNVGSPRPVMNTDPQGDKQQLIGDGFYILANSQDIHQCGMIIRVRDAILTNMEEKEVITNVEDLKDSLMQIEKDEAKYLLKFPREKRLKKKKKNKFNRIQILQVGQECNLREEKFPFKSYTVVAKNITQDGLKFNLKSKMGKSIKEDVDESEITFSKKIFQKTTGPPSPTTPASIEYGRQGSTNSTSSVEFSCVNKSYQGIRKTMLCKPINQTVINPIQIKRIHLNDNQIFDKYIVIRSKDKPCVVKLLWKGLVDDQICIGCDLLTEWSEGTDGEFNDHKLFSCDGKRGVLIPLNEDLNTCELPSGQHKDLSRNTVIIKEEDICCMETKKEENIYLNKTIIVDENCKIKGICKWAGLVNGKESLGIVEVPTGNYSRNGVVYSMNLFTEHYSKFAIIEMTNIPKTIFCKPINQNVINPIHIKRIHLYGKETIDKFIVLRTKPKPCVVKLLWKAVEDDQIILGCDLLTEWLEKPDGEFNDYKLFSCKTKCGVLIPESSLVNSCALNSSHRTIQYTSDKYKIIKEDCICCVETISNFPCISIAIGNKLQYGPNKTFKGSCAWLGNINGEKCVAILDKDNFPFQYKYTGLICDTGICGTDHSKCAIIKLNDVTSFQFVGDLFVENTNEIDNSMISRDSKTYEIGQFVQVGNDSVFYGTVEFFLKYFDDDLVGINVNEDQISKNSNFSSKIKFQAPLFTRTDLGIIAKMEATRKCKEEVELLNNSKFINPDCIKYKEKYNISNFKIGDTVKYNSGESEDIFRIENLWMVNKVPCVEISKAGKMFKSKSIKYVREQDIAKCDASGIQTKYFQETIIDYETVRLWDKLDSLNISVGDNVEFQIRITGERCRGIIKDIGKANGIPSCIIQLKTNLENSKVYRINEKKKFLKHCKDISDPMVIVPADILQKINETVTASDISILDPGTVKTVKGKNTSEKYIAFKINNKRHFLLLKWKGLVNGIYCFGGEIDGEDQFGTNGTFGETQLFKCKEKCGVLISLDKVTDCCLNMKHKDLMIKDEKIVVASICCMKTKAKLDGNPQINIHERLQKKNSGVNGKCNWLGLVNNKEAVFIELRNQIPIGPGDRRNIFNFRLNCGAFFEASDFSHELMGVPGMPIGIIDPFNIKAIENEKEIKKIICAKIKQKKQTLNLKWRGVVNGELSVGCQLTNNVEYGSDGCYLGRRLFTCPEQRGVLIPVDQLGDSCEYTDIHREIEKTNIYVNIWRTSIKTVKLDCVCCIESLESIQKFPHLCIDSRVKYKDFPGSCKWIGLVNGKEAVGVEMDKELKEGTNGRFDTFDLFTCDPGKGFLFSADDIIHDMEAEKLHFVEDGVIDIEFIYSWKTLNDFSKFPFKIGDPVKTFINTIGHIGELEWGGLINNKSCVGLDLEDAFEHGINGKIHGQPIFQCPEGHGLLTPVTKIELHDVANKLQQYDNGLIIPYKYMKCEEKCDRRILDGRKINKNDLVFVTVSDENKKIQLKGTLRWCGLMNGIPVGTVELVKDHIRGTDGTFWRQRLFQSIQKRAIAGQWDRITPYIAYVPGPIPEEKKIFPDININSAVYYFHAIGDEVKDLYGTVRWTGVDETGEYLFGIELDDRINGGTDGEFLGQRLFHCPFGNGILAPLNSVMKDLRLLEEEPPETENRNRDTDNHGIIVSSRPYDIMKKEHNLMHKYFIRLLSGMTDEHLRSDILTDLIESDQIDMIQSFIGCYKNEIHLEIYPNVLPYLMKKDRFDIAKAMLELVSVTDKTNPDILYIANEALKKNQDEIFQLALDKCTDKNVLLENGETFLTNLFKEGYSEIAINIVIDKAIFDLVIPNINGESPLLLACKHQMMSCVEKLLVNHPLSVIEKREAINVAIGVLGDCSAMSGSLDNIRKIVILINESETLDSADCPNFTRKSSI